MKTSNNISLQSAKNLKNDEFYTTYETIQKEIVNYSEQFYDKTVLCNCDDPFESNFCRYFIENFKKLKLRRFICTSYGGDYVSQIGLDSLKDEQKYAYILDVEKLTILDFKNKNFKEIIKNIGVRHLNGNGDFESDECLKYLKEADIIVTNPPFSKFRTFMSILMKYNKKFLIIGNMNAITYKEIFPIIKNNKAWLGYNNGEMSFRVPYYSEPRKTRFWIDEAGQKWRSLGNAMWLTNLDVAYRHKKMKLSKIYCADKYDKFDNYDAINISRVADIPFDYDGVMAVPLTILTKYNPDQFEIIGEANHGSDNPHDLFKPIINGKAIFKRILIRRK